MLLDAFFNLPASSSCCYVNYLQLLRRLYHKKRRPSKVHHQIILHECKGEKNSNKQTEMLTADKSRSSISFRLKSSSFVASGVARKRSPTEVAAEHIRRIYAN